MKIFTKFPPCVLMIRNGSRPCWVSSSHAENQRRRRSLSLLFVLASLSFFLLPPQTLTQTLLQVKACTETETSPMCAWQSQTYLSGHVIRGEQASPDRQVWVCWCLFMRSQKPESCSCSAAVCAHQEAINPNKSVFMRHMKLIYEYSLRHWIIFQPISI